MDNNIKAIVVLDDFFGDDKSTHDMSAREAWDCIKGLLKEQKAETEKLIGFINGFSKDAVPVVRCKDCKKRYTVHCIQEEVGNINNQDDWYCADGERR